MAQCTVTYYSSSCMSAVPSIKFYTFPPSSLPACCSWSLCVCMAAVSQLEHIGKEVPGTAASEGPGSRGQVVNVSDGVVWEGVASSGYPALCGCIR